MINKYLMVLLPFQTTISAGMADCITNDVTLRHVSEKIHGQAERHEQYTLTNARTFDLVRLHEVEVHPRLISNSTCIKILLAASFDDNFVTSNLNDSGQSNA